MVKLDKKIITKKLNSKFSDQVFGLISKELFSIDKKILNKNKNKFLAVYHS